MARVMMFARRPRAGRVKTRLAREIGDEAALALYRAFLSDQLGWLGRISSAHDVELWLDGPWEPGIDGLPPPLPLREQGRGDLGERLSRAAQRSFRDGVVPALVLGSDAPTLPQDRIEAAIDALAPASALDAFVQPARDGGYVLLGLRRELPALFDRIPWGGPLVLETTLQRARESGIRIGVGEGWYDIDDGDGLERLRDELADGGARRRAPRTAAVLAGLDPLDRSGERVV